MDDAISRAATAAFLDNMGLEYAARVVEDPKRCPSVNASDRNVGEWIWMGDKGDSRFMCSVCKGKENVPTIMGKPIVWDYCPNCGVRMKGEDDAEVH